MTQSMKDAIFKGQGQGLQGISAAVGDMMSTETKSGSQKREEAASKSLRELGNPSKGAATTEGTKISAAEQMKNMSSGGADHLELGMRKEPEED